ncbi:sigma-70 family RNA polymerase sigma factor [Streptomyces sp. BHT-5-2]|uniref:RNA polymerase sigma factor n=1 Tax=unclassified Streptomyces TaxID=2593676 RepID=UPI001C8D8501|nr:sigma-70 family RNA polymerase sigma factor [Streptomyces sp. BHT-5-2]QZL04872.1 sigma-70 family RNA polymerase sigma factor [Streptomyces sp. BHT-5-2]
MGGEVAQRLLECYPDFMARQPYALRREFRALSLAACQDIAQEAYLRVGSKAEGGGLAPETNVMAYLHRAARNLALDRFRTELQRKRLVQLAGDGLDSVPERRVVQETDQVLQQLVRPAIEEMPKSLQQKVVDLQSQGLSDVEIALVLGISAQQLHRMRNKAVSQLRGKLAGHIRSGHRKQKQHGVRDR